MAAGNFLDATLPIEALEKIAFWKKAFADPNDGISEAQAHAGAEAVRAVYGYSGGADGSKYIAVTPVIPVTSNVNIETGTTTTTTQANAGFDNIDTTVSNGVTTVANGVSNFTSSISAETANDGVAVAGGIAIIFAIVMMLKAVFK